MRCALNRTRTTPKATEMRRKNHTVSSRPQPWKSPMFAAGMKHCPSRVCAYIKNYFKVSTCSMGQSASIAFDTTGLGYELDVVQLTPATTKLIRQPTTSVPSPSHLLPVYGRKLCSSILSTRSYFDIPKIVKPIQRAQSQPQKHTIQSVSPGCPVELEVSHSGTPLLGEIMCPAEIMQRMSAGPHAKRNY